MKFAHGAAAQRADIDLGVELVELFAKVGDGNTRQRFSADWAKDNERRAAAQRAEQQRMADHYARRNQEQEGRQNMEAQERFAAGQRKRWGGS